MFNLKLRVTPEEGTKLRSILGNLECQHRREVLDLRQRLSFAENERALAEATVALGDLRKRGSRITMPNLLRALVAHALATSPRESELLKRMNSEGVRLGRAARR
jgi:hypothetical protein